MLSTRSTTARCTPPGGMRENARSSRSEYEVSRKPRIARVSSDPASVPPKKNDTGTSSASPTRTRRPAPTRFTPFSYFWTCWNVTPSRLPSSVCDIPWAMRRARMRWPTSTSCEVVLLVVDFVLIPARHPVTPNLRASELSRAGTAATTVISPLRTTGLPAGGRHSGTGESRNSALRCTPVGQTQSEYPRRFFRRRLATDELVRMYELVGEPGIPLGVEQRLQPIHEKRHTRNAARVGVIGHPDLDRMLDANIDRNELAAERHDVGRQSADAHAKLDRAAMRRAGVGAERNDPFDTRQIEPALHGILIDLRSLLVNDAVVSHVIKTLRNAIGLDVFARGERIYVHAPKAHAFGARPFRLIKLDRDIRLHAHDVRDLHRATQMDDGGRMPAAEARELRQDPGCAQTFRHRAPDDAAEI